MRSHQVLSKAMLYMLKEENLIGLKGMGVKSARKLIANLEKSRFNKLSQFIAGLGIRHVGKVKAEILAELYQCMEGLCLQTILCAMPKQKGMVFVSEMAIATLRGELGEYFRNAIELEDNKHYPKGALYSQLANQVAEIVEHHWRECGGLFEAKDSGGWWEWMMKNSVRPNQAHPDEKEKLNEVLAIAFMQEDIDGLAEKLLNVLGMR